MVQICPFCKRTVSDEDTICPHCTNQLSSENKICPFCKKQISDKDTACPHCNNLLIYEYPNQVTAKRNAVLFPLGFLLLFSMAIYWFLIWRGMVNPNGIIGILFAVFWLIGLVLYGAYIGKGDKDFWWGR
jgi:RNA polymerase subunit RPABC4/transcription elongation factor Spt4